MGEVEYSNRELDEKFFGIHEKLDLILNQTTRHNGRMSKLEAWRNYIAGGVAVISVIGLPIVGVMYYQIQEISGKSLATEAIVNEYKKGFDSLLMKNGIDPRQIIFNDLIK